MPDFNAGEKSNQPLSHALFVFFDASGADPSVDVLFSSSLVGSGHLASAAPCLAGCLDFCLCH